MPQTSVSPGASPGFASAADRAECRATIRQGSRSFFAASLLLPNRVREPAIALYAFCRLADDAVDLHGGSAGALDGLRERLRLAYAGRPAGFAADRALADVVARHRMPQALPEALLDGIGWDADNRRYEEMSDLYAYAARVAGAVGAMMAVLMGVRTPEMVARACDLGVAMQLTNIARDVGEDARAGRLYLPLRWLREAGIDPDAWLAAPAFSDALGSVVGRLLDAAEDLYDSAGIGIARLPADCRPGIRAARGLYREIGREVERLGRDSVSRRAVVPAARKLRCVCVALADGVLGKRRATPTLLDEVRFLVEAVAAAPAIQTVRGAPPWWDLDGRIGQVLDLFDRLERRDRRHRAIG